MAAVLGVKKFRAYVEGMPFKIVTDHASLKWLMTQKDLSGWLARWSLKLQAFDLTIEHRKDSANVVSDVLSRMHSDEIQVESPASSFLDLESPEFLTHEYLDLKDHVKCNKARLPDLKIDKNHIFKRTLAGNLIQTSVWKLWLPVGLRETVIINAHNPPLSSHGGVAKTLK